MSADSTEREVFEEIDPDPDAVLADFGVASPDDLIEAETTGAHDTIPDEVLDVDDTTAAELFAGLEDVDGDERTDRPGGDPEYHADDLGFEFVGDSDVVVRDDGDVIDASASELTQLTATEPSADESLDGDEATDARERVETATETETGTTDSSRTLAVRSGTADGLELVGPDPTSKRITNDTFGNAAFDGR